MKSRMENDGLSGISRQAWMNVVGMKLKPKAEDWMGTQMLERKTAASGK